MEPETEAAFAIWVTGLPASGKSSLVKALTARLSQANLRPAVLESDVLRKILTPAARYDQAERDTFYRQVRELGALLASQGVPVIFDATANRRRYRDDARAQIPRFLEVYVNVPLEVCRSRDPKGIYRKNRDGAPGAIPGVQAAYEPPEHPDVIVFGERESPDAGAQRVIDALAEKRYISPVSAGRS